MGTKWWLTYVYLFLAAGLNIGLMACGGGGGSGLSYDGLTTPASINEGNAEDLAVGTWLSGDTGTNIDIFGAVKTEQENLNSSFSLNLMPVIFEDAVYQIAMETLVTRPYLGAVQTVSESMDGSCGGVAVVNGSANDDTGKINATVNFTDYCEEDVIINGRANLSGTVVPATEDITDFTMSFRSLTLEEGNESITINGSFSANYAASPMLVTMSYVLRNNNIMKTYWLRDTQFQLDGQMDYVDITALSGRYYDPDSGYVEISIGETVRIYDYANRPSEGSIVLAGAQGTAGGNTKARLVFLNANEYQVEADTNGDGVYNYSEGPYSWSDEIALKDPFIFSENTGYADFFISSGYADSYFMRTIIRSDSPARSIYIDNNAINEQIPYTPAVDLLSAPYFSYVKTLLPLNGPPGMAWEGREYTFFADENGNAALDSGEDFLQCSIPSGAFRQMDIPDVSVTGGNFPTISWQPVAHADNYQIYLFEVSEQGTLGNLVFTVTIEEDGSPSYSYTYDGDLFSQYTMLAIAVIAREEYSSCVLNRSRYLTVHGM